MGLGAISIRGRFSGLLDGFGSAGFQGLSSKLRETLQAELSELRQGVVLFWGHYGSYFQAGM